MPNFATAIRETFGNKYVKVFLNDQSKLEDVAKFLNNLPSVRRANISNNAEKDITVYPRVVYSAEEVKTEIDSTLDTFWSSKPLDPVIKEDAIDNISDKSYRQIIDLILTFGKNLEKYSALYSKFDEEGFREYFLPYLNSMSTEYSATGETFNKGGKTDILIQNNKGENAFIAECKLWKGEGEVIPAIDQLLDRYVTWRDEKLALIIFNKSVKGFGDIIEKAIETLKCHKGFFKFEGKTSDTSAAFIFRNPQDPEKLIKIELIMFNCYS